jgi:hypothetical protein
MKISKDYLRQLIVESLQEGNDFSPAKLPYEFGQEEARVGEKENTNPYYLAGMIKGTLEGILDLLSIRDIKDTETQLKYAIAIVKKLQDRLTKENLPTVSENKAISKDSIRQMIRESLQEGNRNPIRKKFVKTFPTGEFDNPDINPKDVDPMIDLMNVSGMEEDEYEKYSKFHDSFMNIPAIKKMWNEFVAKKKQEISE